MKRTLLLVALIAVGVFIAIRLLRTDEDSVESTQTFREATDAEGASEAEGQSEIESPAENAAASEATG